MKKLLIFLCIVCIVFISCSKGSDPDVAEVIDPNDHTPPTLVSTVPSNGASSVSRTGDIVFNFSETVQSPNYTGIVTNGGTNDEVLLQTSTGQIVPISVTAVKKQFIIKASSGSLMANSNFETYILVKDLAGNSINYVLKFKTGN